MTTADRTDPARRYGLQATCAKCPFRTDVEPYLRPGRAAEIADALHSGSEFSCHETTINVATADGDEVRADGPRSRFCAGAMATMLNGNEANQMMRVAMRLGLFDPDALAARQLPVHRSLAEWVRSYATDDVPTVTLDDGTVLTYEHCGVVGDDCEDPAGFGGYGGVRANTDPPTCNPVTDECAGCSALACESCRSPEWNGMGDQFCRTCYQPEDED